MYQWITLAFLSRSEKRTLWRILRVNDIFGWHREGCLNNGAKFQTPKVEKCNSAAMVDKWPKFLKSTPGFPRELKMGIFAASEKGEIFGGSKLGQFWQGEGGTLEPEAGNTLIYWQICLPCKFWWLDQYWQWWEKIWTVKIWNKACLLENQSKMFPQFLPAGKCGKVWQMSRQRCNVSHRVRFDNLP